MTMTLNQPSSTTQLWRRPSAASATSERTVAVGDLIVYEKNLLKTAIRATVEAVDDGYVASFPQANVSASGETPSESIQNLVTLMVDVFSFLIENKDELGPEPHRQLEVLKHYVQSEC